MKLKLIAGITGVVLLVAIGLIVAHIKATARSEQAQKKPVPTPWNNTSMMVSPFTAVRFEGDNILVTCAGTEYQLGAINGVSAQDILQFSRDQYRDSWQKRVAEDLMVVLDEMGHPVDGDKVSLTLVDPATGQSKEMADAKMTSGNRRLIHQALASTAPVSKRGQ